MNLIHVNFYYVYKLFVLALQNKYCLNYLETNM